MHRWTQGKGCQGYPPFAIQKSNASCCRTKSLSILSNFVLNLYRFGPEILNFPPLPKYISISISLFDEGTIILEKKLATTWKSVTLPLSLYAHSLMFPSHFIQSLYAYHLRLLINAKYNTCDVFLGRRFAEQELHILLAKMILNFHILPVDGAGDPLQIKYRMTTKIKGQASVRLLNRE